jgi:hypothetical protein
MQVSIIQFFDMATPLDTNIRDADDVGGGRATTEIRLLLPLIERNRRSADHQDTGAAQSRFRKIQHSNPGRRWPRRPIWPTQTRKTERWSGADECRSVYREMRVGRRSKWHSWQPPNVNFSMVNRSLLKTPVPQA